MKTIALGTSGLQVPTIAVGCMRIRTLAPADAERFVQTALDENAVFFDHADVYGSGESEEMFAEAIHMSPAVREKIFLQSKCGIHLGKMFDFSKEHILASVDGSLKRLKTEYLDVLLLHRPDALMEPEEVAEAFDTLQTSGKVRHFGVSNHTPMQIQLLQKYVKQPLVANQLHLSLINATMISRGLHMNMQDTFAVDRDGDVLDFCRIHDITIQPWSPFRYQQSVYLNHADFPELNEVIDKLADKYGVTNNTIVIAWLLRHPAKLQPVTGTMNTGRLKECLQAQDIRLTREEWYELLLAGGNTLP